MSSEPAMGREVRGDAGCEEGDADGDSACGPEQRDVPALEEEVEDAEDENQHRSLCKEGGTAAGCDGYEFCVVRRLRCARAVIRRDETRTFVLEECICCMLVEHKNTFGTYSSVTERVTKVE